MLTVEQGAKIIEALGGVAGMAKELKLPRPTIQAWIKRGIPAKIQLNHSALIRKGKKLAGI